MDRVNEYRYKHGLLVEWIYSSDPRLASQPAYTCAPFRLTTQAVDMNSKGYFVFDKYDMVTTFLKIGELELTLTPTISSPK